MIPDRRTYALSKDQPILQEARRRRKGTNVDRDAMQIDFWKNFNLEKLCGWRPELPVRSPRAA